jgi:hypothetical protein
MWLLTRSMLLYPQRSICNAERATIKAHPTPPHLLSPLLMVVNFSQVDTSESVLMEVSHCLYPSTVLEQCIPPLEKVDPSCSTMVDRG